ncbi:glycosyltransferase family 2 protein [Candidatus Saganbacteria bacterium]|nr:glycosyltransferase family 2 protein [Candidatus Saganbacteria bacterium]
MDVKPKLSLVIPVFNEVANLFVLYDRLGAVLKPLGVSYEIIFVDDGSTDNSWAFISELAKNDQQVRALSFSRNFGHMLALTAGLDAAHGEAVITLDADLQHPPELIPELVRAWQNGAEIVNSVRQDTVGAGIFKKVAADFFYWLMARLTKINLPANAADYRLLDRKVVETLKEMKERSRFLRGLISWVGYKQEHIPYQAAARFSGRTKYSFSKMLAFAVDGLASFSPFPLRLATYLGLLGSFSSFLYIIYAICVHLFTSQTIPGWTSVLVAVLFLGGVQLIFLGVIGEYLSRVFDEVKARPLYIVSRKIGL